MADKLYSISRKGAGPAKRSADKTGTKVHVVSLGCAKNRVDSEVMLGYLLEGGLQPVPDAESADVLIVNTCGFIGDAKQESITAILEMAEVKARGTGKKLIVAGCLSQAAAPELAKEFPEVDAFIGTGDVDKILATVKKGTPHRPRKPFPDPDFSLTHASPRVLSLAYSAYVKISEGCSNACTFCSIPSMRGKQRSRTVADVVAEVKNLRAAGVVEVNLIAQDLCAFGKDRKEGETLADLLRALDDIEVGQQPYWLRCLYAYPRGLTREVQTVLAQGKHIVPYLDMPLQHVSDSILRRMKRGKGGPATRQLVETLRKNHPRLTLRTTFLVGFPGETDKDFAELVRFVKDMRFERMGVFAYSPEESTPSAHMPDQVPHELAEERRGILLEQQKGISRKQHASLRGKTLDVLVEGPSEESELLLQGRHACQAPEVDGVTYINDGTAKPGDVVRVKIEQTGDYDLVGGIEDAE
jgi:ribosomal protein S12 methylthiotransferase